MTGMRFALILLSFLIVAPACAEELNPPGWWLPTESAKKEAHKKAPPHVVVKKNTVIIKKEYVYRHRPLHHRRHKQRCKVWFLWCLQ